MLVMYTIVYLLFANVQPKKEGKVKCFHIAKAACLNPLKKDGLSVRNIGNLTSLFSLLFCYLCLAK